MKYKGIKKAIGELREWESMDNRYVANIMVDLSDGRVWVDCFTDGCTKKIYESNSIKSVSKALRTLILSDTMKNVKKAIEFIKKNA